MIIQMVISISILLLQGQHGGRAACSFLCFVTFRFTMLNLHSIDCYGFWPLSLNWI